MDRQNNYKFIEEVQSTLKNNKIEFIKYRNSLIDINSSVNISPSAIQLSQDGQKFNIYTKKFKYSLDEPLTGYSNKYGSYHDYLDLVAEQQRKAKEFTWKFHYNATFKISDVKGFIFGGFSSRFWSFRK